jgi:hypothetical protein
MAMWAGVALLTSVWIMSLPSRAVDAREYAVLAMLCFGTYLLTSAAAYLSVRALILFGYAGLLVTVSFTLDILQFFAWTPAAFSGLGVALVLLTTVFFLRVYRLNEEDPEYPFLISWPLHRSMSGGPSRSSAMHGRASWPVFQKLSGAWARAGHWAGVEREETKALGTTLVAAAVLFQLFVALAGDARGFYARPFAHLFLFLMLPLLITLAFNYRILSFRAFALTRPLGRAALARDWGLLLFVFLAAAWVMVCVVFAIAPAMLMGLPFLGQARFWAYLVFAGAFSAQTLASMLWMMTRKNAVEVLVWCIFYGLVVMFYLQLVERMGAVLLFGSAFNFMIVTISAGSHAYRAWSQEEA